MIGYGVALVGVVVLGFILAVFSTAFTFQLAYSLIWVPLRALVRRWRDTRPEG